MGQTNLFSFVSSMLACKNLFKQHRLYCNLQVGIIFPPFIEMQLLSDREWNKRNLPFAKEIR